MEGEPQKKQPLKKVLDKETIPDLKQITGEQALDDDRDSEQPTEPGHTSEKQQEIESVKELEHAGIEDTPEAHTEEEEEKPEGTDIESVQENAVPAAKDATTAEQTGKIDAAIVENGGDSSNEAAAPEPGTNENENKNIQAAREAYKNFKHELLAAQKEYLDASRVFEEKRHNAGFLQRFMASSAIDAEKNEMLKAERKYDVLLDELRSKREERMKTFIENGMDNEKAVAVVARHEALLERRIDHEVQLLEALRYKENEAGDPRNKFLRFMKKGWNWYRKLPMKKRLAIGALASGAVGATLGATGLVGGGALVAGGTFAGRRAVGGFFGAITALETKRFGDTLAEAYGERKFAKEKKTFKERDLSASRKKRLAIKKDVRWGKRGSTVVAAGAAIAVGGKASSAFGSAIDIENGTVEAIREDIPTGETRTDAEMVDVKGSGGTDSSGTRGEDIGKAVHENVEGKEAGAVSSPESSSSESQLEEGYGKKLAPKEDQVSAKLEAFREKAETNSRIAQEMGISDTRNLRVTYGPEGKIEMINGIQVPDSILQEKPPLYSIGLDEKSFGEQMKQSEYVTKDLRAAIPGTEHEGNVLAEGAGPKTSESVGEIVTPPLKAPEPQGPVEEISSNSKVHTPEKSAHNFGTIDDAFNDTEIADLYKKLIVEEPKELKMEGVYEAGSSVERELQQFLKGNDWVKERYPNLTDTERGKIAHRIRLELEKHPEMAENLKVKGGDWNRVFKEDAYSIYIDRELIEHEIRGIHADTRNATEAVPATDTPPISNIDAAPSEPTPQVMADTESGEPAVTSKSIAEEMIEELRKSPEPVQDPTPPIPTPDIPEFEGGTVDVENADPELVGDVAEKVSVPEEVSPVSASDSESAPTLEPVPESKPEVAPEQETMEQQGPSPEVETGEQKQENVPKELEEKTVEDEFVSVRETFKNQGLDYQGNETSPYMVDFFADGVFDTMLKGQKHFVLANWGPISHARLDDIFDGKGSLTFTIGDNPPVSMSAQAEQYCRSIVFQLERGLTKRLPNVDELIANGRKEGLTLGEMVKKLSEELAEKEAADARPVQLDTPVETVVEISSATGLPEALPIEQFEKPELVRQSTSVGIDGAQASYKAKLSMYAPSDDIRGYVEKQYLEKHPEWNSGIAKELYESSPATDDFRRTVDTQLADITIALRGDELIPLSSISIDWSALGMLTPRELLEQLEQYEEVLEKQQATEKILDSNASINVEQ